MPMKITEIRDYCFGPGYSSPKFAGLITNTSSGMYNQDDASVNTKQWQIAPRLKAIEFSNLQIFSYAYSPFLRIQVRDVSLVDTTGTAIYVATFDFDSQLKVINYSVAETTVAGLATFNFGSAYFAIAATNQIFSDASTLYKMTVTMEDYSFHTTTAGVNYVAVGFNGKVIDSMFNGGGYSAPCQVYVNGKNVAGTINTGTLTTTGGYVYWNWNSEVNIDYFVLKHNEIKETNSRFIIHNHKIIVYSSTGGEITVKQNGSSNIETFYGTRYFLFDDIGSSKINAGITSSISMFGLNAALNRGNLQTSLLKFNKDKFLTSDVSSIINKITAFEKKYATPTNQGFYNETDIEPAIKNMSSINYGTSNCINATCSFQCSTNCEVLCKNDCGIRCSGACANNCGGACGGSLCGGSCGSNCTGNCNSSCSGTCKGVCTGTCGSSTCASSCGTDCSRNCMMGCSGRCAAGSDPSGSCVNCWGVCRDGGCDSGCRGNCSNACYNSCGGVCYGVCSGGGCQGSCTGSCNAACNSSCDSSCTGDCNATCSGITCGYGCNLACSSSCSVICLGSCTGSCTGSCSTSCVSSAGNITYI